jgi:hypothetical protein
MNRGGVRIGKMSLRLRGVTAQEARLRADSIAREVARAVAAESALPSAGKSHTGRLSVRLRAEGTTHNLGEQIRIQWPRK